MTSSRKWKEEAWIKKKRYNCYSFQKIICFSPSDKTQPTQETACCCSCIVSFVTSFTPPRIWVTNIMDYVKMINERTVFLAKDRPSCWTQYSPI